MSPEAERLRIRLSGLLGLSGQQIAIKVVTELGITDEMVSILRSTFDVSPHRTYANDRGLLAAYALATLLEVAAPDSDRSRAQENPDVSG